MRTTVTLDEDVVRMLRNVMHRSRRSFKDALNRAVRAGLAPAPARAPRTRFIVKARPMGLRAGIDPAGLNKLADELEIEATRRTDARTRRR